MMCCLLDVDLILVEIIFCIKSFNFKGNVKFYNNKLSKCLN